MKARQNAALSSALWLVAANGLIAASVLLFATGFFPYKPVLPGLAQYHDDHARLEAPFDRLIFMVVDALRRYLAGLAVHTTNWRLTALCASVTSYSPRTAASSTLNRMHVSNASAAGSSAKLRLRLIRDGAALPFTAHATSPTVTMPRLKAITTGSIPSFLDAILNLDETDKTSSLASQDSWLAQMKAKGTGKVVMYGDDTWLKLFPGTFDRADGTTSFFVSVWKRLSPMRFLGALLSGSRISPKWTTTSRETSPES
jgi:ethanolaminephosphotransferase